MSSVAVNLQISYHRLRKVFEDKIKSHYFYKHVVSARDMLVIPPLMNSSKLDRLFEFKFQSLDNYSTKDRPAKG